MYIPPPAVDGLLAFITKASGPGSAMIADFFETSVVDGTSPLTEARVLKQFVESEGAALQFGIQGKKGEAFFRQRGFQQVNCVGAPSCKDRFFEGVSRNRSVSTMFNFVTAIVGIE